MVTLRSEKERDFQGDEGQEGGAETAADTQADRSATASHHTGHTLTPDLDFDCLVDMLTDQATALAGNEPLPARLQRCAQSIVDHLGAAFARIWEYVESEDVLQLKASAGMYTHLDGPHSRIEVGQYKIGQIAKERKPHITNDVLSDPAISDKEWAEREGMVSFAGYPLLVEGRLVGVLAMFAGHQLSESTLKLLGGIGIPIAMAMERDGFEAERERFRQLFLGMLGHDLRNPLGAIAISAQMLARSVEQPQHTRAVERICRSTDRMARMISQLLDFAGARSLGSTIPIQRQSGDLHAICREVVEELRPAYPDREIIETYEDDASGSWDIDRMAQVFSNLIENALNYGDPAKPVLVTVRRRGDLLRGEVHNFGEPIPPALVDDLFDPFRRVRNPRTPKTKGLGLGLYITHQIIVAHRGTLFVVSSQTSGTTFRFSLPVENANG